MNITEKSPITYFYLYMPYINKIPKSKKTKNYSNAYDNW